MITIKSTRAQKKQAEPAFFGTHNDNMRTFNGPLDLHMGLVVENGIVKNLSIQGSLEPWLLACLEGWGEIILNRPLAKIDQITLKETEAFLRDRNSEYAIEGLGRDEEILFGSIIGWVKNFNPQSGSANYTFLPTHGPFRNLKLAEKVNELKKFLSSSEVFSLYQGQKLPELVDVEELTIYIDCPYSSEEERSIFEKLHMLGAKIFREEELNFIPEG